MDDGSYKNSRWTLISYAGCKTDVSQFINLKCQHRSNLMLGYTLFSPRINIRKNSKIGLITYLLKLGLNSKLTMAFTGKETALLARNLLLQLLLILFIIVLLLLVLLRQQRRKLILPMLSLLILVLSYFLPFRRTSMVKVSNGSSCDQLNTEAWLASHRCFSELKNVALGCFTSMVDRSTNSLSRILDCKS